MLGPCISIICLALLGIDEPARPRATETKDFKLEIRFFGPQKGALASADLIVRNGIAYEFASELPDEVIIIEPTRSRIVLLDLERRLQTEIGAKQLDASLGKLYSATLAAIERREKSGTRADKVAAAMSRDLIDPRFKTQPDPDPHRLILSNPSVEIRTESVDEPDLYRLQMIMNSLAALNKLSAVREPDAIPPFTRIAALRAVSDTGKQRPIEMSCLYRLAGPPRRLRWTYKLAEVTERESNALKTLDALRLKLKYVTLEEYDADDKEQE
jgi:hypothetical protein